MIRVAQLLLVLAAVALWVGSRLTWVEVNSFDGLGQPRTTDLNGAAWSTALLPLALLLLAAAAAALAVRGWPLRVLSVLVAAASAGMGYLAIGLWVIPDVAPRAVRLADLPVWELLDTERHYLGAVVTLGAAVLSLVGAVLLMRAAARPRADTARYSRRAAPADGPASAMSERAIWDALDEGADPTRDTPDPDTRGGDR
ncbi:TIGR02234 family membrane protein [Mycolicibacterium duvalii]|uniref:Membrane protein n=1 Tax=Mycolicibacterium duvalii TaxID=39688 RepID=A0A7I7JXU3_9MYCO|nr:TIGR02234 family membrane protein [Mycolicibacterium duvalii]MCV7366862.1 TIGR02234 family membrane protein [Mycolicibacterium duvalii]PEG43980.1 TIGR02234 family membrane protein [Mycolicibacterium duvalii]BBX16675.1 membrane protein [Mycolicibacterium duvalii]